MSESADTRRLTSVELLDAAVWREIGSEEAQPPSAFLDALSRLVGRWREFNRQTGIGSKFSKSKTSVIP